MGYTQMPAFFIKISAALMLACLSTGCAYVRLVGEVEARQGEQRNLQYHKEMARRWVREKDYISAQRMQTIWSECLADGELPTDDNFSMCLMIGSNCALMDYAAELERNLKAYRMASNLLPLGETEHHGCRKKNLRQKSPVGTF